MSVCNQCGQSKSNLANHWRLSSDCEYPDISQKNREVLTGILIGDGTLDRSGANCRIKIEMINEKYLQYVDSLLGNLSNGVGQILSAKESAQCMRDSGFRPNASPENFSPVYRMTTKRHPAFNDFADWYASGEKVIPKIDLTKTVLKHWYVCDGHLMKRAGQRPRVAIGVTNEYNNSDKLEQMFTEIGVDANVTKSKNLDIGAEDTEKFFEFIGDHIKGFKYKWPQ